MKEMYPEIDADAVMIATYREFGIINGRKWGRDYQRQAVAACAVL